MTGCGRQVSGYAFAALAAIMWSFIGPLSKICLGLGVDSMEIAFWRALLGGLCFAALCAARGEVRVPLRHGLLFFLFGGWSVGVLFGALQQSIKLSGAAMAMVLLYTAPAWVAVASRLWFGEALTRRKMAALAAALGGVALMALSGGSIPGEVSHLGILCGLLAGMAYASHFPFYAWWGRRYSVNTIYAYMLLGGSFFLFPFVNFVPAKPLEAWVGLAALGGLTNFVAYIALAFSLQRISQLRSAVIGNIEPVLATLWVWLFYGENFTAQGWFGGGLVLGAVFLLTLVKEKSF